MLVLQKVHYSLWIIFWLLYLFMVWWPITPRNYYFQKLTRNMKYINFLQFYFSFPRFTISYMNICSSTISTYKLFFSKIMIKGFNLLSFRFSAGICTLMVYVSTERNHEFYKFFASNIFKYLWKLKLFLYHVFILNRITV